MLYAVALLCLYVGIVAGQHSPPACGYGCVNGAPCEWAEEDQRFSCTCPQGYTGMFCETQLDDCRYGGHCYYEGSCETGANDTAWCNCVDGLYGHNCEKYMTSCHQFECVNGGTCNDGSDSCTCPEGFTGRHCETVLPACESCSPNADCPWGAPCECVGECPDQKHMMRCYRCSGYLEYSEGDLGGSLQLGRDCFEHPENSPTALCSTGCQTLRHRTADFDLISRDCDWGYCWDECRDEDDVYSGPARQCTECCHDKDHCNIHKTTIDGGTIATLSTVTTSLACMMAIVLA